MIAVAALPCATGADESVHFSPRAREVIESRLKKYGGDDRQREETLKQLFREAGCEGQYLSEQKVFGEKVPNVLCKLPGSSNQVIIVGAHFDYVVAGYGVVDNWSGASLLPSLYEAVKVAPRKHTYIFVGFTDEEHGEYGSNYYAGHMSKADIAAADAMVNMDTLGLGPTEIWVGHSDQRLSSALAYIGKQMGLPVGGVDVVRIGSTDSEQFAARKIPVITVHSLTQETWNQHILHTSKDKFSAIRMDDYYQTYKLLSAYLAFLDDVAGNKLTTASGK